MTANRLASWLAERTVLKQALGSMWRGRNRKAMGASVPLVEFGSPMPKLIVRSHLRMRSRLRPEPRRTTTNEV